MRDSAGSGSERVMERKRREVGGDSTRRRWGRSQVEEGKIDLT